MRGGVASVVIFLWVWSFGWSGAIEWRFDMEFRASLLEILMSYHCHASHFEVEAAPCDGEVLASQHILELLHSTCLVDYLSQ